MRDEHTGIGGPGDENASTRIGSFVASIEQAQIPLGPRESFLIAYPRMAAVASAARKSAVLVAVVRGNARVSDVALVQDRSTLVLGRHTQCDLRLDSDTVSLRHLALLARREQEGRAPMVHLWDLNTHQPFFTEDGSRNGAIIVEGAAHFSIGGFAIWMVPSSGVAGEGWPDDPQAAWKSRPPPEFIDQRPPSAQRRVPARRRKPDWPERTLVTSVGPALLLDEGDDEEMICGEIYIQCGKHKEKRRVSPQRLDRGILVGRYDRCGISTAALDTDRISRVHVLLVRIGGEVWAIDTASTNGVWDGGRQVVAEVLGDRRKLGLGDVATIEWKRL